MADYKRMVSYMYEYVRGSKRKNVGYARIEVRNGQCKITIHLQLLGQLDSIFPTYLIERNKGQMELIYLGDSLLKNQIMDSKLLADEQNVMDTGYGFSDMGGILIFLNDEVFFATEWDDKPIVLSEVLEAMRPKPANSVKAEMDSSPEAEQASRDVIPKSALLTAAKEEIVDEIIVTDINKGEIDSKEKEEIILEKDMNINTIESSIPQIMKSNIEDENNPDMDHPKKQPETPPVILKQEERNQVDMELVQQLKEEKDFIESNSSKNLSENKKDQSDSQKSLNTVIKNAEIVNNMANLSTGARYTKRQTVENKIEQAETQNVQGTQNIENPIAMNFFNHYPRIYPFDDNEVIMCVKIEPKDIGYLPMDTWALSNNSFLLHGYYCYNHIIFAKMKDRYGSRYILGVPGIYHNREKFMARMFGFDYFKSIRKRELKQGDFGYWYLTVAL